MFKKKKIAIKQMSLEDSFIKKSDSIYRNKHNGTDYFLHSPPNPISKNEAQIYSWDEILAAHFLKHAGVLVPEMLAVHARNGWIYVAASMISNVKNCTVETFNTLPEFTKQQVYASIMIHYWLGNSNIMNSVANHLIIDSNNRVFHMNLGAALATNAVEYLDSVKHGQSKNTDTGSIIFADPYVQREYHLQGALMIARFSDEDIKNLVEATGHSAQDKELRINTLSARRIALLQHIQQIYGVYALQEEQLALELQRIFHKQGIFKQFEYASGTDAVVGFRSQFSNAIKPGVTLHKDNTLTIHIAPTKDVELTLGRLSQSKFRKIEDGFVITLPFVEFKKAVHAELIANILQVFFASFGYKSPETGIFYQPMYKGDGHDGFRPQLHFEANTLLINLPINEDEEKIRQLMIHTFNLEPECIKVKHGVLQLDIISIDVFVNAIMEQAGVSKTAVVSENSAGQILAGKLNKQKKGVTGFATAGGNSAYPYNPVRAARAEGVHEFGYSIDEEVDLIPIGSTLASKQENIFLIASGGTSEAPDHPIFYPEFEENTIQYYNFTDFREYYKKYQIQFERCSVAVYLRHYECEIQKLLHMLGIENLLIHISQKPATLGKMKLKPSINCDDFSSENTKYLRYICELLGEHNCFLNANYIEINEQLNPAQFYNGLLQTHLRQRSSITAIHGA
ncbi:MAG: hypothetical protein QM652_09865 [Legionella sp.]|uniref:hypothetical protein n=1 Tax=Legionella sp. TaxID=459 RepID=UPI0039E51280